MSFQRPIAADPRIPCLLGFQFHGLPILLLLVIGLVGAPLLADDDDEAADAQQNGQNVNQPQFVLTPEQFDQWVFNGIGNCDQAMKQLETQINMRIEAINRVCKLSEAQKQKLHLAADSDIKRFRDKYDELKQKLQNTRHNQNDINKIFTQIQPLQLEWNAGILGDSSVYNKVLHRTLDPDQSNHSEKEEAERDAYRYQAKVKLAVMTVETSMPLTDKQREAFIKLLLEETHPPKTFGQYDFYVVMFQAAKIKPEKLSAIFDEPQMRGLKQAFQQAEGMQQILKQEGVLPD